MKWMTINEAKKAGRKSKRAAIASCKKHWKQNYTATEAEIKSHGQNPAGESRCALCYRYGEGKGCVNCPLTATKYRCCKEYDAADNAFQNYEYSQGLFATWQKKAKAMYDKLCSL